MTENCGGKSGDDQEVVYCDLSEHNSKIIKVSSSTTQNFHLFVILILEILLGHYLAFQRSFNKLQYLI